jgi:hypothetical protein
MHHSTSVSSHTPGTPRPLDRPDCGYFEKIVTDRANQGFVLTDLSEAILDDLPDDRAARFHMHTISGRSRGACYIGTRS